RWDEVLEKLELQPSKTNPAVLKALLPGKSKHYGGGGESEEHRLLKEYIANTPSCVGLKGKRLRGNIEYIFPSADKIDILFEIKKQWIGVEVKSVKSNQEDILRGLYQCVKYRALIEAHQKVSGIPIDAEVLLALGGPFPPELFGVRNLLDIAVVDNIKIQLKA
ncbi:MAG: hypothetical protein GY757_62540, partial [bacterium]|nr:hypothetical protein [bacterium]